MFNKIYLCDLRIISEKTIVKKELSKRENIKNADTEISKTIIVQPTLSPLWFREIITKKLIPAYCITQKYYSTLGKTLSEYNPKIHYDVPNFPYFIKYSKIIFLLDSKYTDLIEPNSKELKSYLDKNMSKDGSFTEFEKELDDLILEAVNRYNTALAKNEPTTKELLSDFKRVRRKNLRRGNR